MVTETMSTTSEWDSYEASEESEEDQVNVTPTATSRPRRIVENTVLQNYLQRIQAPIDEENRLYPYCFQNDPQWGPNEERTAPLPDPDGRCGNTLWCKCNCCQNMTSVVESMLPQICTD